MDQIAYLKGLLDGQETDRDSKNGRVFYAMLDALEELVRRNAELEDRVAELEELCDILDEDLGEVEDLLIADDDEEDEDDFDDELSGCGSCNYCDSSFDEDEGDFDDEQYETICPTCGECILLDETTLEEGTTTCPNCGEELEFDFDEHELAALTPEETLEEALEEVLHESADED